MALTCGQSCIKYSLIVFNVVALVRFLYKLHIYSRKMMDNITIFWIFLSIDFWCYASCHLGRHAQPGWWSESDNICSRLHSHCAAYLGGAVGAGRLFRVLWCRSSIAMSALHGNTRACAINLLRRMPLTRNSRFLLANPVFGVLDYHSVGKGPDGRCVSVENGRIDGRHATVSQPIVARSSA